MVVAIHQLATEEPDCPNVSVFDHQFLAWSFGRFFTKVSSPASLKSNTLLSSLPSD
jgi:hypothetical protein